MTTHLKNTLYQWRGKNQQGQLVYGEITALSINLAKASLQRKNIQIIAIQKKKKTYLEKKIPSIELIILFRQLATLIISGISISQAMGILSQNAAHSKLARITSSLKDDITAGNGLAFSMQKFPAYFDEMTCSLIFAGEKSGTLDIMLEKIAHHKEKVFTLQNKIKQALFYPVIVLLVAVIITIIMLIFVIPRFAELFSNAHAKLPAFTVLVIHLAELFTKYWPFLLILFIALPLWLHFNRHLARTRFTTDAILLKLPVMGVSLKKFILTSWARNLATLFAAGIPITEALKILEHTVGNLLYKNATQMLILGISSGKQLHFAMQRCKLFPTMMRQMVQIGEESGTLEKMLIKIADFYESDLDHLISYLGRLLEPLIMIILGVVIGGLVMAMYLPIFKLGAVI